MNRKDRFKKIIEEKKRSFREMSAGETCRTYMLLLLRLLTAGYVIAMGVILPLYIKPETDYLYIADDKMHFFANISLGLAKVFLVIGLIYAAFFLKGSVAGWRKKLSLTDKFVLFYAAACIISYLCSAYREETLYGAEGWYMGLLPQLCFVGSYFAISRLLDSGFRKVLTGAMLAAAFLVFLLGVLNRFGVNPLGMESGGPLYISTIGNINWYCGYWSVLFPLGAGLFFFYKKPALGIFTVTGLITGLTQGSDSGVIALVGFALLAGWLAVYGKGQKKAKTSMTTRIWSIVWWIAAVTLTVTLVSFAVLLVMNTHSPGSIGGLSQNPLFTFCAEWGSNRGGTWMAGLRIWWEQDFWHKLTGVGPDGMEAYIGSGSTPAVFAALQEQFGTWHLTNAHNEWITLLADVGILGLVAFVGMVISGIVRFARGNQSGAFLYACALSLFTYTVNNMFSFEQVMNITQMFIILGLGENALWNGKGTS